MAKRITYAIFTELKGGQIVEGGFTSWNQAVAIAEKLANSKNRSFFVRAIKARSTTRKTARKSRRAKNPPKNFKGRMKGYPKHVTLAPPAEDHIPDSDPEIEKLHREIVHGDENRALAKQRAEELNKYYGVKAVAVGDKVKVTLLTDVGEKNFKYWESQGQMKWNPLLNIDGSPKRSTEDNPVSSTEDVIKAWLDGQPDSVSTYRGTLTYVPQGKKLLSYGQPLIWWDEGKKSYEVDVKIASYSMVSRKHYHLARRM